MAHVRALAERLAVPLADDAEQRLTALLTLTMLWGKRIDLTSARNEAALAEMGADHMMTSVIYGDTAYEVVNGFLGIPEL